MQSSLYVGERGCIAWKVVTYTQATLPYEISKRMARSRKTAITQIYSTGLDSSHLSRNYLYQNEVPSAVRFARVRSVPKVGKRIAAAMSLEIARSPAYSRKQHIRTVLS